VVKPGITPERWRQVTGVFHAALACHASGRTAYLDQVCAGDDGLREEVEAMLAAHQDLRGFGDRPVGLSIDNERRLWQAMLVGETLGRYTIESKLGEGGMGVVYKAHDTRLERTVAIKVLPHDKVSDPARKQRFVQEARAASALNHPNIVTVHDICSEAGMDFIVMEHLAGKTLDRTIPAKGLRMAQALHYGIQITDALAKAHEAGIIHRDLKPSNVMVTDEGRVKILDFGLAKLLEPMDPSVEATTLMSMTEEGVVIGTAAYMSPEQAEGRTLDGRSDIFSFGSVLYEMVTGRKPFSGESPLSLLAKVVTEDPVPPSSLTRSLPPELERTILRCLRKDPARRYQTMADLKVALEDVERESAPRTQVGAALWRRWIWIAVPAVLLLTVGSFAWRTWRSPQNTEPLRAVPLTSLPGAERYPSLSPDGNYVAFTWNGPKQDNADIYVQQIGVGSPLRLTNDQGNDHSPAWSPDGRWIAFLRGQSEVGKSEVRLIPPLGGPERKLADIRPRADLLRAATLAWCPASDCIVVTDSVGEDKPDALFAISLESREKRQLTYPQHPLVGDTDPAVSPDGRWLVFRRNNRPFVGELYRLQLETGLNPVGEPSRLTQLLASSGPAWTPDSKEILFPAKQSLWRLAVSGESPPARLPFVGEDGLMPTVSRPKPGGLARLVYMRSFQDTNIWRVDTSAAGAPASSPPRVVISSTRFDSGAEFSPDSRQVAFMSSRSGESEVWLADPDGGNAVQLTSMGATPGFPQWSPDGALITFHSDAEGPEIYVIPAAGGKPRNVTSHPAWDAFPSFSRDGRWVYFSSNRGARAVDRQIWKTPASGGEADQVTNGIGAAARESPDGAYLYYVEALDRPSPLWRQPTSGGAPVRVLDGVVLVSREFVVLKGGIYYIDRPSSNAQVSFSGPFGTGGIAGEARLQYFDFATGKSRTVTRNLGNVGLGLTVSSDGRTILYSRVDSSVDDLMLVENFR
jgi:serine/threonine protein kinase/Tol biopolymer transport system component